MRENLTVHTLNFHSEKSCKPHVRGLKDDDVAKLNNVRVCVVKACVPMQYFGELALLANEPRAASVVATTDVALLKMSKEDFEKSMGPLAKYLTDKARSVYGLMGPATKDIKLSDLKIVRSCP